MKLHECKRRTYILLVIYLVMLALNTRALQESMMAVGQALGSNAMLNKEDLVTATKLREQAGFTNDEIIRNGRD
jgi:hypothetical protein